MLWYFIVFYCDTLLFDWYKLELDFENVKFSCFGSKLLILSSSSSSDDIRRKGSVLLNPYVCHDEAHHTQDVIINTDRVLFIWSCVVCRWQTLMKIQKTLNTSVWQHNRRLDCASVCDVDVIVCLCSCGQCVCVSDNNNNINWEERDIQLYQQKKSSLHLHRNRRVINKINNVNSNNIYNSKHKTNMTEREKERDWNEWKICGLNIADIIMFKKIRWTIRDYSTTNFTPDLSLKCLLCIFNPISSQSD